MKTVACVIAIAMVLTGPAFAAKKFKRAVKPVDTMSEAEKTNDASWRLVKGSLPIWLPSWALPIYVSMQSNQDTPAPTKPKKVKRRTAQR